MSFFEDYFDDNTIGGGWTEATTSGGSATESGTSLWITSGDDEHPNFSGLYQTLSGTEDFDVKLLIIDTVPTDTGSAAEAGLAFWIDDTHYMTVWKHSDDNYGHAYNGDGSGSGSGGFGGGPPFFVRIVRSGSNLSAYRSINGIDWTAVYTNMDLGDGACRLYVFANDDAGGGENIAEFGWILDEATFGPRIYEENVSDSLTISDSAEWFGETSIMWGEEEPATGARGISWQNWNTSTSGTVSTISGSDWGYMRVQDETVYSDVYDTTISGEQTFTLSTDTYQTGSLVSGTKNIYIRGDASTFNWNDGSPSWNEITTTYNGTWRYIQLKVTHSE